MIVEESDDCEGENGHISVVQFSMDNQRLASIGAEATGPAMHHPRGASRNLPKSTPWRDDIFEQRTATRGGRKVSV